MLSNVQIAELVKKGKESEAKKFPESVEAILTFRDVDPKKNDLNVNETVYLPHPGSHRASICFVGSGDLLLRAKNAGVDGVVEPAKLESYAGNKKEAKSLAKQYDFFLADTALMPRIGRILGQYMGPRGKIPTPVPPNAQIEGMINRTRSAVRVRSRGSLGVGAKVGDRKQSDQEITDNIVAMIQAVQKKLPNGDKNIKTVAVKTSMGKPVKAKVQES